MRNPGAECLKRAIDFIAYQDSLIPYDDRKINEMMDLCQDLKDLYNYLSLTDYHAGVPLSKEK